MNANYLHSPQVHIVNFITVTDEVKRKQEQVN